MTLLSDESGKVLRDYELNPLDYADKFSAILLEPYNQLFLRYKDDEYRLVPEDTYKLEVEDGNLTVYLEPPHYAVAMTLPVLSLFVIPYTESEF